MLRRALMVTLNVVAVILLLICAKIPHFSPANLLFSNYPNYLFLILWLVNLCFFVYWLLRFNKWIVLSLVAGVLCFSDARIWFPVNFSQKEDTVTEQSIKVLTYNTMQFSKYQPHTSRHPNAVVSYLLDSEADILCLQEGGYKKESEFLTRASLLESMSRKYPYHSEAKVYPSGSVSLWIFSKYPIVGQKRLIIGSETNAAHYCDIDVKGRKIRVINNHLESNKLTAKDKDLYHEILEKPEKETVSSIAHSLGMKLSPAAVSRAHQAEVISEEVRKSPYPVIVCGDFNDIPNSYTYRTVRKGLTDAWVNNATGMGISFHEKFYRFRIDYIMHSPSLHSFGTGLDRRDASDHYPVWTYINLPQ